MVHPGSHSVQLRDEERRKYQAKLLPCNLFMAYDGLYKAFLWLEKLLVQRKATFWQKKQLEELLQTPVSNKFYLTAPDKKKHKIKQSDGQNVMS